MRTLLRWAVLGLAVFLLVGQVIPYGRDHANPAVRAEPSWNSTETRDLAMRACGDCHSNETTWPWYSNVAPVSWLVQRDVDEGRDKLNFSEWVRRQKVDEVAEAVQEGEMPPWYYGVIHPGARLSDAERTALIEGFNATFGVHQGSTNP
jgi:hypothetical protein